MPGTILLVYGLLFWYCMEFGWWHMGEDRLWALFIMAPGLGFLAMYALGKQDKGFLVPAIILIGLGVIFMGGSYFWEIFWPVVFILVGVWLLMKGRKKSDENVAGGTTSVDVK